MSYEKWFKKNTASLEGKTVAISGSTGGLGGALCEHLASLGADLLLLNRNEARSDAQKKELEEKYGINVRYIALDLENAYSVFCPLHKRQQPFFIVITKGRRCNIKQLCHFSYCVCHK